MNLFPGDLGNGKPLVDQKTLGAPPDRRAGSIRRTIAMQCYWPHGPSGSLEIIGTGRDLYTGEATHIAGEERLVITMGATRRIARIEGGRPELAAFAGMRVSGELRQAMAEVMPEEVYGSTITHRILDELAGTNFMASAAWFQWSPASLVEYESLAGIAPQLERDVTGVCISFQKGSPSLNDKGHTNEDLANHPVLGLPFRADDPLAWHPFEKIEGPNHWRIRFMDMWREPDDTLRATAGFQDACAVKDRADVRQFFHEYRLEAAFDPDTLVLRDIEVTPGPLPFRTCLSAPASAKALVGTSAKDFRRLVPEVLAGGRGCTHLNEVLRALQDVEALAKRV